MKTRSDEEEGDERKRAGGGESHDPRYDIVLMLSQPVVIEM